MFHCMTCIREFFFFLYYDSSVAVLLYYVCKKTLVFSLIMKVQLDIPLYNKSILMLTLVIIVQLLFHCIKCLREFCLYYNCDYDSMIVQHWLFHCVCERERGCFFFVLIFLQNG